jgi:acyl transferase domain-containing protein
LSRDLEVQKIKTQRLTVSHAFHSPLMEPILEEFEQVAGELTYQTPGIGLVSNVTGEVWSIGSDSSNLQSEIRRRQSSYWRAHVREAVQFAKGMNTLAQQNCQIYLEMGPNPVLLGMGKRCLKDPKGEWLASLRKGTGDWQQMLDSLARLYVSGATIDWTGFDRDYPRRKVVLPA